MELSADSGAAEYDSLTAWTLPTLYKRNKHNKLLYWRTHYEEGKLYQESGHVGGKAKTPPPKDISMNSRSSSLSGQAFVEARGKYRKKLREGYSLERPSESSRWEYYTAEGRVAMRPQKFEEKKVESWPVAVETKHDGVRTRALLYPEEDPELLMVSRGGIRWGQHMEGLRKELRELLELLPPRTQLDGELYRHGYSVQIIAKIMRTTTKRHPQTDDLGLVVFDLIPESLEKSPPYLERRRTLEKAFAQLADSFRASGRGEPQYVFLSYMRLCRDLSQIHELHSQLKKLGFEGAVVKLPEKRYVSGEGFEAMKLVDHLEEEFEVVGFYEGQARDKNAILFEVKVSEKVTCKVKPEGSIEERRKMFREGERYVGKMATVSFKGWTDDGSLFHPVLKAIRDYE